MNKLETKGTGTAEAPKFSPWAEQLVRASLPQAPQNGTTEAKAKFVQALAEKLKSLREFERLEPRSMESVVLKREYREVARLEGHTESVWRIRALPDGRIVSGSHDGTLRIWTSDAQGKWGSEELPGHDWITDLHLLPDGSIVSASCVSEELWPRVSVRGVDGKWSSQLLAGLERVSSVQAIPDGRIVSGSMDGTLRVWTRGADGEWSCKVLCGHTDGIKCLDALPDGRIVSGSFDYTLRVWTCGAEGEWTSEVLSRHSRDVRCVYALADGRILSEAGEDPIYIWSSGDSGTWSCEQLPRGSGRAYELEVLPDGSIVSYGWWGNSLRVMRCDAQGKWGREILSGHRKEVTCMQALPDGRIVSGSEDRKIRIWTRGADEKWSSEVFVGDDSGVLCLQVLPDGKIISGGYDGSVRIWDGTPVKGGGRAASGEK